MKANELRIGNFVQGPLGEVAQITQLGHKDNPNYIEAKNEFFQGQNGFLPIPLTEEWLLKFGFKFDGLFQEWINSKDLVSFILEIGDTNCFTLDFCRSYVEVEHVHQLQNLYFALTGEELTLKEP